MDEESIDLECGSCGFSRITPGDVEIHSEKAIDIHCPDCGAKTMHRESRAVFNPGSLWNS